MGSDSLTYEEKKLSSIVWEYGGIIRSGETLSKGVNEIHDLREIIRGKKPARLDKWLKLKGMLELSELLFKASLERKESRGAHYRIDYPFLSDSWFKHIIFRKEREGVSLRFKEGC
ncbi:MAG: hypothetical protein NZ900_00725 [Synergistetes bacterium]|nr:hypothetical protein [Synergistota bacterium]